MLVLDLYFGQDDGKTVPFRPNSAVTYSVTDVALALHALFDSPCFERQAEQRTGISA